MDIMKKNRITLIDMLETYNNEEYEDKLNEALQIVSGLSDEELLDDSDPNEGFYAHLSTEELMRAERMLRFGESSMMPALTANEYYAVVDALQEYVKSMPEWKAVDARRVLMMLGKL